MNPQKNNAPPPVLKGPLYAPAHNPSPAATPFLAVEIPFTPSHAWPMVRLDGKLDPHQARALRLVFDGLVQRRAKLQDGHEVKHPLDAVRWVLERAAEKIPGEIMHAV